MLDNTTKIKDIIASLQETEGINQKAELKSILVDKGIPVEDTNDMASRVNKVNELVKLSDTCIPTNIRKDININGIIGTLDLESLGGKRWASGDQVSSTNTMSFTLSNGGTINAFYVEGPVLAFTPSILIVMGNGNITLYNRGISVNTEYPLGVVFHYYGDTNTTYNYQLTDPLFIDNVKFRVPVNAQAITYSWIAIE